jgi:cytochrome c peroxidase
MNLFKVICGVVICSFLSCAKEEAHSVDYNKLDKLELPKSFPTINFPIDNEFRPQRWSLGKKLFFDKRLSEDGSISCANCHKQAFAFADNTDFTDGVHKRKGARNSPSLANIAYHPYYTREGGIPSLEMQVLVPISEHNEFGFNLVLIVDRLKDDMKYQELAMRAYGRNLDAYTITRAISNYERSIISSQSRYDDFINGNSSALTESELRGKNLFFSEKTNCNQCHSGFNFTDYGFKSNGLYLDYIDPGRFRLTNKEEDIAVFKTPSLRNVGFTAPYMHDGSFTTLEDVIVHYNLGGVNHPNKSKLIKPLGLSESEIRDLKAFLLTLNDYKLLENKYFKE